MKQNRKELYNIHLKKKFGTISSIETQETYFIKIFNTFLEKNGKMALNGIFVGPRGSKMVHGADMRQA